MGRSVKQRLTDQFHRGRLLSPQPNSTKALTRRRSARPNPDISWSLDGTMRLRSFAAMLFSLVRAVDRGRRDPGL